MPETDTTPETETPETKPVAKTSKVKVRAHPKVSAFGGVFYDPETRVNIGAKPVSVEKTAFVMEKLRTDELVEA